MTKFCVRENELTAHTRLNDCVYMHAIFGFEVEYDQYSDSAKSCKRVHIPNIAIIGFGNIPNELAGICQPNRNMMRKNGTGRRIIPKPTSSCTSLEQTSCTSNLAK